MMSNYGNIMMDSPRSSPHGGRSPVVARQDSSGTLKTTISLGKTPTIIHTGPFYSMKEPPAKAELTGDKDLMTEYGLHHTLTKFKEKKFKESLASFLPNIPGINDLITHPVENSTLRSVIEKPPIGGKELLPLTAVQLAGFRLHPGPLPEQYRTTYATPARKHKNKHKKHKHKDGVTTGGTESTLLDSAGLETYEKKHKKQKRHEDDKERKKRKKEKKRKKKNQSPEPGSALGMGMPGGGGALAGGMGAGPVMGATAGMSNNPMGSSGVIGGMNTGMGLNSFPPSLQMQQQQQPQQQLSMQHQQQHQHQQQMPSGALLGSVLGTSGGGPGGNSSSGGAGGPGSLLVSQF
ncbi:mediator of RNA polymerase II transcription subunit 19 [Drosophila nasuta]|uniref:Mediator of RNA polymerase II transcription subunit 19 n=1 Tax=Drosophila albomicans TaxID=7291 RepID=A0A6P8Y5F8_DROAB|nr:mediator of RNA polymerase II transcription subunit 19 [Drosophila albomicans]XP_060655234.1 mediator of RNA polymerase II transcription subunit 19 [Drosophila nasuta]